MMKGVCLRYAANETEAEDILQEAFIRSFKNLRSFSAKGPLGAWLRKITVNTALEQYRKNKSIKKLTSLFDQSENNLTIDDGAIEQLELEDLLLKIQQLPTGFRTVFNLYAVEGYNHREIGELLGISSGTSKSQYSRARVLLRTMIETEIEEDAKRLQESKRHSESVEEKRFNKTSTGKNSGTHQIAAGSDKNRLNYAK